MVPRAKSTRESTRLPRHMPPMNVPSSTPIETADDPTRAAAAGTRRSRRSARRSRCRRTGRGAAGDSGCRRRHRADGLAEGLLMCVETRFGGRSLGMSGGALQPRLYSFGGVAAEDRGAVRLRHLHRLQRLHHGAECCRSGAGSRCPRGCDRRRRSLTRELERTRVEVHRVVVAVSAGTRSAASRCSRGTPGNAS